MCLTPCGSSWIKTPGRFCFWRRAEVDRASRHGGFLGDKRTSGMKTRLDRLARSTRDLLNTLAQIADKGVGFYSLTDAWADTATAHGGSCSPCWTGLLSSSAT